MEIISKWIECANRIIRLVDKYVKYSEYDGLYILGDKWEMLKSSEIIKKKISNFKGYLELLDNLDEINSYMKNTKNIQYILFKINYPLMKNQIR